MPETVDREAIRAAARARRLATCKHWRGALAQPPCGAGVDLVERVGPRRMVGWALRIPCCDAPEPAFVCERKDTPTAEEVEASERDMHEGFGRALAVMAAIPADKTISHGEEPELMALLATDICISIDEVTLKLSGSQPAAVSTLPTREA